MRPTTTMPLLLPLLLPLLWAGSLALAWKYQLNVQKRVTVQEGLCVSVPCTVSYPQSGWNNSTPASGYWFQEGDDPRRHQPVATNNPSSRQMQKTKGRFFLLGDPKNHQCSLDIRDAKREDTGIYFFRLERGTSMKYSYVNQKLFLLVTALTEKPDIHILETLQAGRPSSITCSVPWACTSPTFSWIGRALIKLGTSTPHSSVLTLIPQPQDHGSNLTCRVSFPGAGVTVERTIQLNVAYAPRNLTIRVLQKGGAGPEAPGNSSLAVLEGTSLHLICQADSSPPSRLSWTRGNLTLSSSQYWSPRSTGSRWEMTLELQLPWVGPEDHGSYVCSAQNSLGSTAASLNLSVLTAPHLQGPSCSRTEDVLSCNCSSRGWPVPTLHWQLGDQPLGVTSNDTIQVTASSEEPWTNGSLSLHGDIGTGLRLSCEAWNAHGIRSAGVLLMPGPQGSSSGLVLGAVGGVGVAVLLALCLIFLLAKLPRRKWAQEAASWDDRCLTQRTLCGGHLSGNTTDDASDCQISAASSPTSSSEKREEPHYAVLSFHKLRPRDSLEQEATEYSEIKIRK